MEPAELDSPSELPHTQRRRFFPPAAWLRDYRASWLGHDALAGVTLAAYAIPVSLAYAGLAGVPPVIGIYGYLLGGIGYALLGSSRHLAVGPTSAISLMVGATVAQMAGGDPQRHVQIAVLAAFMVAAMAVLAWLLRLSSLTSFISETNLLGFKAGAALSIASTQLAAFFGVAGGGSYFIERVLNVAHQLGGLNPYASAFGVIAVVLLVAGDRHFPGRPIALGVVLLAIAVVALTGLDRGGLAVVGSVPSGLPQLTLPELRPRDVDGLMPLAVACLLLAYIEGVSAARAFADKHGYPLDTRQELLALGGANLLAALGGGYPVAGGLSQSAVNEKAGARSPAALLFASATLAVCLLFLTGLVQTLPRAVLAAIVLVAVKGLIDVPAIARLWRVSRFEFWIALVAFAGVLALGILKGIVLAAVVSILGLIRRAATPHVARLGELPESRRLADVARHPDATPLPGLALFRVEAALLYFNAEHVEQRILRSVGRHSRVRLVICDLSSSPHVDLAGARMLAKLGGELARRGAALAVAGANAEARRLLDADHSSLVRVARVATGDEAEAALAAVDEATIAPA
jgi:SulP family sulfate permease